MSDLSYALVTPSFRLDLERCRLLVESVERQVVPAVRHYLVIDRRDVPLFRDMVGPRTELLVVEDLVPAWIHRLPGVRRFWWSWRSRPVKNWILQQIVKLSIGAAVRQDVLLYVDSDVIFTAPFDPRTLERGGAVPLFVEAGQKGLMAFNDTWHGVAARLLGLPVDAHYDTNFIGNVICWRRDNVARLLERVEEVARRHWVLAVAPQPAFSEYILYGLYATRMAGGAGHYHDASDRTLSYWDTAPLDGPGLEALRARLQPHHHSVMISAKSRTPPGLVRGAFLR